MILCIFTTFLICGSIWLYGVEASCHAKDNPNGSVTYSLTDSMPDTKMYSWLINGTVAAHEDNYDQDLVLDHGPQKMTTKRCWEDVAMKDISTGERIPCSHNCPSKQSGNGPNVGVIAGVSVGILAAAAVLIGLIVWRACRQRQTSYSAASQNQDTESL